MTSDNSKSKPRHCGKIMHRLYIRKGTEKRKWIAVGYYCDECSEMLKEYDLKKMVTIHEFPTDAFNLVDRITNPQSLVLDPGFSLTKVGFTGEKIPRFIFDSVVYYNESGESFIQLAEKTETTVKIKKKHRIFNIVENREELNKDVFEIFLTHIFEKLKVKSSKTAVWVIEKYHNANYSDFLKGRLDVINNSSLPEKAKQHLRKEKKTEYVNGFETASSNRRAMAEVFFNVFKTPKVYFSVGELLSLYADNQVTGVVVGIGANSTRIVPIYEGFIISHGLSIRERGGVDVVNQVKEFITKVGLKTPKSYHVDYQVQKNTRLASEEFCYIADDVKCEMKKRKESDKYARSVNVVHDIHIKLDEIRYLAPEILFENEPLSILNKPGDLADAVIESIQKCDKGLAKSLYSNILLVGGGTLYEGFSKRFYQDLKSKIPDNIVFNATAKPDRLISAWIGGSILSGMKLFEERKFWVSKAEYEDKGSSAVDRCI
ncbi:MAG: actin family protein [Candidatus Heimdallarchaeota archaeon]|nr:actin family protein [Candidatus Heimdallarchaeota archaeon]